MKMSIENGGALQRYSVSGAIMGTRYSAVFFASSGQDASAIAAIDASLFAAVDQVDRQMSTWKADSDLSRLNRAPVRQWLTVPRALAGVLQAALDIGRQSGGAFDIGVGKLVDAWGFGPQPVQLQGQPPALLASAALEIDHDNLRVRKLNAAALDLSGIAKGYGVSYGEYLFGTEPNSTFIGQKLKEFGVQTDNVKGSINLLRRMVLQEYGIRKTDDAEADARHALEFATRMGHNPNTQQVLYRLHNAPATTQPYDIRQVIKAVPKKK